MIKIDIIGNEACIYTPFNSEYVHQIKRIDGAHWNYDKKVWIIPKSKLDIARKILEYCFGYSDIAYAETVKLKITMIKDVSFTQSNFIMFKKDISCYNKTGIAYPGTDIIWLGGDMYIDTVFTDWVTVITKGSTFTMDNVNKEVYEFEKNNYKEIAQIEVLSNDYNDLLVEKDILKKRIKEINRILWRIKKGDVEQ